MIQTLLSLSVAISLSAWASPRAKKAAATEEATESCTAELTEKALREWPAVNFNVYGQISIPLDLIGTHVAVWMREKSSPITGWVDEIPLVHRARNKSSVSGHWVIRTPGKTLRIEGMEFHQMRRKPADKATAYKLEVYAAWPKVQFFTPDPTANLSGERLEIPGNLLGRRAVIFLEQPNLFNTEALEGMIQGIPHLEDRWPAAPLVKGDFVLYTNEGTRRIPWHLMTEVRLGN